VKTRNVIKFYIEITHDFDLDPELNLKFSRIFSDSLNEARHTNAIAYLNLTRCHAIGFA